LSNQPERFPFSVPALIYNRRKWWLWIYDASLCY